jgi:hypothetical protein
MLDSVLDRRIHPQLADARRDAATASGVQREDNGGAFVGWPGER